MYVASLLVLAKTLEVTSGEKNDNPFTCTRFANYGPNNLNIIIHHSS